MKCHGTVWTLWLTLSAGTVFANQTDDYDFQVYLDDKQIGAHRFEVTHREGGVLVSSEARFDVKFLFMTVYSYRHSNQEVWRSDCLQSVNATTRTNGDETHVKGRSEGDETFVLQTPDGQREVQSCVRSFAYWDKAILRNSSQLLNTQTGELVDVAVESLGKEQMDVGGRRVEAERYRLSAGEMEIDLWYRNDAEWVALESNTESGGRLRYRLQGGG